MSRAAAPAIALPPTELAPLSSLKPHPRNYRAHPEDEIAHLMESIRRNGVYRNVVLARDDVILAGHGVVEAARRLDLEQIPVVRLDLDALEPAALKLLVADNEIAHLVENDDRLLSELLKEVKDDDLAGLLGTGYDEKMLANLVMVTRPASEIADIDAAAHWVGMPEYDEGQEMLKLSVNFRSREDMQRFAELLGVTLSESTRWIYWPPGERDDLQSIRFQEAG